MKKTVKKKNLISWDRLRQGGAFPAFFLISFLIHAALTFRFLDGAYPLNIPDSDENFAVTVEADDGSPLRGFPDRNGVWRYPVIIDAVSPLYLEALIHYEDRFFRHHPGVNPFSLIRAFFQCASAGRFVSGGSTLTMQVARIFHPHPRTVCGKISQIFRSLQLEYQYSKDEILTFYLNYAPFGGPVEGVRAASFTYLDKPPGELSHAEAALLAVLPQAPTRLRPDRHPDRAAAARDKVLNRMAKFGVWEKKIVSSARIETVVPRFSSRPMTAPLLARRLKNSEKEIRKNGTIRTFIDPMIQGAVADLIRGFIAGAPERTSAAVLVVENAHLAVRAYAGSADFTDESRFGHVDMVRALRSPGSALKPFLYGIALEEGLIHSESLLVDAPFSFGKYRPGNFTRHFTGPVSAADALRRSLNLPAVDLLNRIGPAFFNTRLLQSGVRLHYPVREGPNLSMILGGVGISLEDLVGAYTSLARQGLAGRPRLTKSRPVEERRLLSPGAACIIRLILQDTRRPDLPAGRLRVASSRRVAWKTGTSYGFRDAWTVGVTDAYTVGVWLGRPDGTAVPGQYGRVSAAPLLFQIVDSLPRRPGPASPIPETVERKTVCWPLGTRPTGDDDPLCHERRQAWLLDGAAPPTFGEPHDSLWLPNPLSILVNPATGLRVEADCMTVSPVRIRIARWPRAAGPWLTPRQRRASRIPSMDPACGRSAPVRRESIRILGVEPDAVIRPPGDRKRLPSIALQARGGNGELYWMLDGDLIARGLTGSIRHFTFKKPGRHRLTVMDAGGNYDSVSVVVMAGRGM